MTKTKIVYETDDTEYEFIGNIVSSHDTDVLFRSRESDDKTVIGEIRMIHNHAYYCSEKMKTIEQSSFFYWKSVKKKINRCAIFCDLIEDLEKGIMT
jgi:hypothetical protein